MRIDHVSLTDLKENREEIISLITELDGPTRLKEIMALMVRAVDTNVFDDNSSYRSYVKLFIEVLGEKPYTYSGPSMEEINRKSRMSQMPSSMRRY